MRNQSIASLSILLIITLAFAPVQDSKIKLQVSVIDNYGNNVEGATINIYSSAEDYQDNKSRLVKGKTDKKGKFQFKGLESKSYFLEVKKDNLSNKKESAETGLLSEDKINKILVVIE